MVCQQQLDARFAKPIDELLITQLGKTRSIKIC